MNTESICEEEIEYENFKKFLERYFDSTNDFNKNTDENITHFENFYKFRKEFFSKYPRCENKLLYDQIFIFIANIFHDKADQVLSETKKIEEQSKTAYNPMESETQQININELRINLNDAALNQDNITRSYLQENEEFEIEDQCFIELPDDEAEKSTKEFLKHFPVFQNSSHFENGDFDEVIHATNSIYNKDDIQLLSLPDTTLNIKSNSRKQKSIPKPSKLQTQKNVRLLEFQQLQAEIAAELETDEVANTVSGHLNDLFESMEILHSNLQTKPPSENLNETVLDKLMLPNYIKFIQNNKLREPNILNNKTNALWKEYWNVKKPNFSEQDLTIFICNYVNILAVVPPYEDTLLPSIEIRNESRQRVNSVAELPFTSRDQSIQNVRESQVEYQSIQRNLSSIDAVVNSSLSIGKSTSIPNVTSISKSNLATELHSLYENESITIAITPDVTPIHTRQIRVSSTPLFGHLTRNLLDVPEDIVEVSEILIEDQSLTPTTTVGVTSIPIITKLQPIAETTNTLTTDLNVEMNSDHPMTPLESPVDEVSTENLKIDQPFQSTAPVPIPAPIPVSVPATDTHENIQLNSESIPAENNNLVDLRTNFVNTDEYRKNWFEVLRSRNDIDYFELVPEKKRKYKPKRKRENVIRNGVLSENHHTATVPVIDAANQLTANETTTIEQAIAVHEHLIPEVIEEFINQNIESIDESSNTFLLWKQDIMDAFKYNVGPSEPKLMSDVEKWGGEFLGTNVCEILKLSLEKPFVNITDLNPPHMNRKSAALRFKLLLDLNGKLINIQATDNTVIGYSLLAS